MTDHTATAKDDKVLLFQALQPAEAANLVAVMSRIVPHRDPRLREVVWYTALAYDARLATDTQLRNEIRGQLKELDQQAVAQGAASFADAPAELQDTLLRAIDDTALFQNLVYAVVADFYNRHLVWEAIGYPGLAQRDGQGFLHRGFDVVDWGKPAV
ncbi:gluconate 2-dehydrogenase subunit 3 family protein [Mycobacterium sp.]|uniref:gluconate 2-dehydrogenase subunit 3 family protein n=1 Tax=Mycobacterium sp. TaxID=1785 RepID=UPI0012708FB0|nr:gluconate 2-dehydrogenase subunit 3 family protein [Mycobacterium sp.]KAA8959850.1 MAG: gluconate 2-dehydrogenase subunit 3 family protein [Mycobacterium sp.]